MKKPSEMTPEELSALPEYKPFDTVCITSTEMLADYPGHKLGDTIHTRRVPEFLLHETGPNAIAFWRDADGSWTPVKTSEGWFKQPFYI
jgi:hypothetical protein